MLYLIGDSHTLFCFAGVQTARLYWTGPRSMHRVGRDGVRRQLPLFCNPGRDDHAVFIFGEIDCRALVEKIAARKSVSLQWVLEDLAKRYTKAIAAFARRRRVHCAVCTMVPPVTGTDQAQVGIRQEMNRLLRDNALSRGLNIVDVYNVLAGPDGFMNPEFHIDKIHVNPARNRPVVDELNRALGTDFGYVPPTEHAMTYAYVSKFRRVRKRFTDPPRLFLKRLGRLFGNRATAR